MWCHIVQVNKSWNPTTPGTCLAPGPSFTAYAIVTIISDVVVAVIPIPVLLQLKVSTGKKVGLIVIFLLGLFTTLCSVFRYLQIDRIQYGDGNSTMLILWGVIEFNVGVSFQPCFGPHPSAWPPCLTRAPLPTERRFVTPIPGTHLPPQGERVHVQVFRWQRERVRQRRRPQDGRQAERRLQAQQCLEPAQGHFCHGQWGQHGQRGEHPQEQPGKHHCQVGHVQRACRLRHFNTFHNTPHRYHDMATDGAAQGIGTGFKHGCGIAFCFFWDRTPRTVHVHIPLSYTVRYY